MAEDIAASYAPGDDGAITAEAVNDFLESEVVPLHDLRERRRKLAEAQGKADEVKSKICDKVNADTPRELHDRIMDLRDTDRELYDYIWRLRSLKYGIWCVQCEQMKQIGGRDPEDVKRDVEAEARGEDPGLHAAKKHVQLSQNNKMLPLLTGPEKAQIEQRHGSVIATSDAPRIGGAPGACTSMTRAQLAALPESLRKTMTSDPNFQIREPGTNPRLNAVAAVQPRVDAVASLPPEVLSGMDQRVAALVKLRDQIGEQLKQVDTFVTSLQQYASAPSVGASAEVSATVTTASATPSSAANEKKSLDYDFGDGTVVSDDSPDIDSVIEHAMKMNMGDSDVDIEGF